MRIALNAVGEVGIRTGRILAAESQLVALGIYGDAKALSQDRRTISITSLDGYDALVTDDESGSALVGLAADDGLSSAVRGGVTAEVAERCTEAGVAVLTNCSLAGLANTLAAHEAARTDEPLDTVVAWTEQGKPLRRGTPVAFPDPVGARWGRRVGPAGSITRVAVPVDGEWAGATTTVVGITDGATHTRIVGVADATAHLEGIALAAGAAVAATTDKTGPLMPDDVADDYLEAALRMGLGVATYTLAEDA